MIRTQSRVRVRVWVRVRVRVRGYIFKSNWCLSPNPRWCRG